MIASDEQGVAFDYRRFRAMQAALIIVSSRDTFSFRPAHVSVQPHEHV